MKKALIVVDKSWIDGRNKEDMLRLSAGKRLLLPDMLFYELTTTNARMMAGFKKLTALADFCDLIENIGGLLRYEINNNLPSSPFINKPFLRTAKGFTNIFNQIVNEGFTPEQEKIRDEEQNEREIKGTESLKKIFACVPVWFPELNEIKPGSYSEFQSFIEKVAADSFKIKSIYEEITGFRKGFYPSAKIVDENWAFYRRVQVHLLAGIEYCQKYGVENTAVISKKLPNEFLDLEYLIIATLADGLATCENRLQKLYKLICPNGILIQ